MTLLSILVRFPTYYRFRCHYPLITYLSYNVKKNKENNKIFYPSKRLAQDGEDTGSFKIKEMENFLSHHKEMVNILKVLFYRNALGGNILLYSLEISISDKYICRQQDNMFLL